MKTRRQMLFDAKPRTEEPMVVPATVSFKIDKRNKRLTTLQPREKMVVALRKVLATMSSQNKHGCRYYIEGNKIQMIHPPTTTQGKAGDAQKYAASGRCRVGVCHKDGHKSSMVIQFALSFKDIRDERGLPDVAFFDPTTIEELPRDTPINVSALA